MVTVGGHRAGEPANRFVPFGTNCHELLHPADPPMFLGGPMVALPCPPETVTGPDCDAVLALDPPSLSDSRLNAPHVAWLDWNCTSKEVPRCPSAPGRP